MKIRRKLIWTLTSGTIILTMFASTANAAQYSSPNYQLNEVFVGNGGELNLTSPNYSASGSVGSLGVGNSSSPSYQAQAGFNTFRSPYIALIVNNSSTNLGALSSGATSTSTASFSVKAYLANGYIVQTDSPAPSSGSHILTPLSSPAAATPGLEQFGMNLVADTNPNTLIGVSANPVQQPDNTFSYGTVNPSTCGSVTPGYDTANEYKYNNGDVIAASCLSSGETDYTISYIFDISNKTPAGAYHFNDVLVATATY
jgi:hypothetical protein